MQEKRLKLSEIIGNICVLQKKAVSLQSQLIKAMRLVILGQGNVGTNLHHAFGQRSIRSELLNSRADASGRWQTADGNLPDGDVYIYAVTDQALAEVAARVDKPKALHLHTSGTVPVTVFGPDKPHAGVLYFFQSFSKEALVDDWSGIPCFIEGRNIDDVAAIYSLAQCLTSRIYEANQHDRERLHIAGVFANNYTNLMYRIAAEILGDTQIPFEALLPLIDLTAAKVHQLRPKDAQTGPAQRGDEAVMAHHAEVISNLRFKISDFSGEELSELYQRLAALIEKGRNR